MERIFIMILYSYARNWDKQEEGVTFAMGISTSPLSKLLSFIDECIGSVSFFSIAIENLLSPVPLLFFLFFLLHVL